LIINWFIN